MHVWLFYGYLSYSLIRRQRWSDYNTNVLEYDYFEHAWVRIQVLVLSKQMYLSTITLNMHEYEYKT